MNPNPNPPGSRDERAVGTWPRTEGPLGPGSAAPLEAGRPDPPAALLGYFLLGIYLGIVFIQSEVVSWFRIQEMFRFQSFHMYGIIGSALAVAAGSMHLLRRLGVKSMGGEPIRRAPKEWGDSRVPGARYWIGGTLFGMGWALLGACPGPIFALIGAGIPVLAVGLASALLGTWTYAALRPRLPH